MEITYRKLRIEEAQDFWNMMNQLDHETSYMLYEPGEREEKAKSLDGIKAMITAASEEKDFLLIAECGNEIAGYLSAERGNLNRIRHTAYIVTGIRKEFRGQGIGTKLFDALDTWAKKKGITRLELTVMCPNTVAKHLYEKNGFVVEGIKKNSIFSEGKYIDEYYMAKML